MNRVLKSSLHFGEIDRRFMAIKKVNILSNSFDASVLRAAES